MKSLVARFAGLALLAAGSILPLSAKKITLQAPRAELVEAPDMRPMIRSQKEIWRELRDICHPRVIVELEDLNYFVLQEPWFDKKLQWFRWLMDQVGITPEQLRSQNFDGDNVARLWMTVAEAQLSLDFDLPAQIPIGYIRMRCEQPWETIPGDGKDRNFLLLMTDSGYLVFCPHAGHRSFLKTHPNRASALRILF